MLINAAEWTILRQFNTSALNSHVANHAPALERVLWGMGPATYVAESEPVGHKGRGTIDC